MRAALSRTRKRLAAEKAVSLVLYGDSISEVGRSPRWYGGASAPQWNWGAQLKSLLEPQFPASRFTVTHFGIGGQNAYEGLGRLDWFPEGEWDLVLIAFGANDCGHHYLPPDATAQAVLALVEGVRTRFQADAVLLGSGGDNPRRPRFRHLEETNQAIARAAAESGVPFVDTRQAVLSVTQQGRLWTDYHCGEDNCHPNDRGHTVWAQAVLQTLLPLLGTPTNTGDSR